MCGLAGIATVGGQSLSEEAAGILSRMSRAVGHRGPDAERRFQEGPVGLAFHRLALVSPDSGDQPLVSEDGTCVLIANGEVYNHRELEANAPGGMRLTTKSDCEVLPNLYTKKGLRFLDDVQGMYALALWDRKRNRLVFARDRFGIKPLYYAWIGDTVVFASEIKALFEHPECPRELDWEGALADQSMNVAPYLTDAPVNTWFRHIHLVPAGSIVTVDLVAGDTSHHTYWSLPPFDGHADATDEEFIRSYRDLLTASVADCASADTELGLFLSGGVDSAAVAALAAAHDARIHTFTVLSGSTFVNGDSKFGHRVAVALDMPNHQVLFDAEAMPQAAEWKRLLWLLETPLCGPEQYFKFELYRYAKHARPDLRGMLLGTGSDEYNGGFSTVFGLDNGWTGFEAGTMQMARSIALHGKPPLSSWWEHRDGPLLTDALLQDQRPEIFKDPYSAYVSWRHRQVLQYNCWHEDRTAAGNGIEARVPFLDHRIVELLAQIPARQRASLLWDKRILREAVRDLLPTEVVNRPKVPFYYGEGAGFTHRMVVRMLMQNNSELVEEALSSPGARQHLRPDAVRAMLGRLQEETEPWDVEHLFRLINLGLLENMAREVPPVPLDAPQHDVLPSVSILDWAHDSPAFAARLRDWTEPTLDDVIELNENFVLVQEPEHPDRLYVTVNGVFEYVVDTVDDPALSAFLRAIDGRRTLGELLDATGQCYPAIEKELHIAVETGMLRGTKR